MFVKWFVEAVMMSRIEAGAAVGNLYRRVWEGWFRFRSVAVCVLVDSLLTLTHYLFRAFVVMGYKACMKLRKTWQLYSLFDGVCTQICS